MTKKIDEDQFVKAVMVGLGEWINTDLTDYWNWVGARDMARFMWRCLDKRVKRKEKEKLSFKNIHKYSHLFGKVYWRVK